MNNISIYLDNILHALDADVAPLAEPDARARASLRAVRQILARLAASQSLAAAPAVTVRDEAHILSTLQESVTGRLARRAASAICPPADDAGSQGRLEAFLRTHFASPAARVTSYRELLGGRSKITALIGVENCPVLPERIVMRRDAVINMTGGVSVMQEYPLLQLLHQQGLRVPAPLALGADVDILGSPFILMRHVEGAVGEIYETPGSAHLLAEVAAALAGLHGMSQDGLDGLALARSPDSAAGLQAEIAAVRQQWIACEPPASVAMETAFAWLEANAWRGCQGASALVHGDLLFHNIMFDGDRLTALLEWELARISYPAADLGYIRPAVDRVMPWEAFMQHYRDAGGPEVAADAVDFHATWSNVRMAVLAANCRRMVLSGETRDIQLTAVCLHDIAIWNSDLCDHLLRVAAYG